LVSARPGATSARSSNRASGGSRQSFPGSRFVWLDIEDQSEVVGDIEVENFPTLAVFHGHAPVHFGITEPQEAVVRRLLQALAADERRSIEVPQAVLTLPERLAARGR
jgi:thioredoxin reductase (NADPH)